MFRDDRDDTKEKIKRPRPQNKRSGMRWTLDGARSMLNVRAAFQSDHWRGFLDDRMQREITSTHRHRELMTDYQAFALAC